MKFITGILLVASIVNSSISANLVEENHLGEPTFIYERVPVELSNEIIKNLTTNALQSRIAYGMTASEGQFPYMAQFFIWGNGGNGVLCGGTLIRKDFVLTAAHCLGTVSAIDVYFGSIDRDNFPVKKSGFVYWRHPTFVRRFDSNICADIALVKMESSVSYTPALLPTRASISQNFEGARMTLIGFGSNETGVGSKYLQYTYMTGRPNNDCGCCRSLPGSATLLCAKGDGYSGARGGDSGSGLYSGSTVVGVDNFSAGGFDGYTRVDAYLDWISSITGIQIQ